MSVSEKNRNTAMLADGEEARKSVKKKNSKDQQSGNKERAKYVEILGLSLLFWIETVRRMDAP